MGAKRIIMICALLYMTCMSFSVDKVQDTSLTGAKIKHSTGEKKGKGKGKKKKNEGKR